MYHPHRPMFMYHMLDVNEQTFSGSSTTDVTRI
jgi:hypothetical protein